MSFINPHRLIVKTVLLYTELEGGRVEVILGFSKQEYEDTIEKGYFESLRTGDKPTHKIYPAYMAFANIEDGYDFKLELINTNNGFSKGISPLITLKEFLEKKR